MLKQSTLHIRRFFICGGFSRLSSLMRGSHINNCIKVALFIHGKTCIYKSRLRDFTTKFLYTKLFIRGNMKSITLAYTKSWLYYVIYNIVKNSEHFSTRCALLLCTICSFYTCTWLKKGRRKHVKIMAKYWPHFLWFYQNDILESTVLRENHSC